MRPDEILEKAAETFRQRAAAYGPNYLDFGDVMLGLFPKGLPLMATTADWNRLGIVVQIVTKLTRYCNNMANGGHLDSAHDMVVYAALLEQLTEER